MVITITRTGEENYKKALEYIDRAKVVYATYLVPSPPYPGKAPIRAEEYWRRWEDRLEKGDLTYYWLVSIENGEKFRAIVERITKILETTPEAVKSGRSKIRVILNREYLPMFNFQVCDESYVIIGFAVVSDEIDYGLAIEDQEFAHKTTRFFLKIWERAIPFVDIVVHYDKLREVGQEVGLSQDELSELINRVREAEMWHALQYIKISAHLKTEKHTFTENERIYLSIVIKNDSGKRIIIDKIKDVIPVPHCELDPQRMPQGYAATASDIVPVGGKIISPGGKEIVELCLIAKRSGDVLIKPELVIRGVGKTLTFTPIKFRIEPRVFVSRGN